MDALVGAVAVATPIDGMTAAMLGGWHRGTDRLKDALVGTWDSMGVRVGKDRWVDFAGRRKWQKELFLTSVHSVEKASRISMQRLEKAWCTT